MEQSRHPTIISDDGLYRYRLDRWWGDGPRVAWIMLNPSTADADVDDPTIRRCIAFTKAWGYDGLTVVNLYALRATDPKALRGNVDAMGGLMNWQVIDEVLEDAPLRIAAWGVHGTLYDAEGIERDRQRRQGRALHHLGLTKEGHPRHPLYVRGDTKPIPWAGARPSTPIPQPDKEA